jgi:hypothetical protein
VEFQEIVPSLEDVFIAEVRKASGRVTLSSPP